MIRKENRDGVVLLAIEHGKVNALDAELLEAMEAEMQALESEGSPPLVLTGNGKAFSAGVDLYRLLEGGAGYVERFLPSISVAVGRIFDYPGPVVAAVNGHAIAGGYVLAAASDVRLMTEAGGKVGLTELPIGVAFPWLVLEVVRHAVGERAAREMIYRGRLYDGEQALAGGLVDELVPATELEERALAAAAALGAIPPEAFRLAKRNFHEPLERRRDARAAEHDEGVAAVWKAKETHERIRAYMSGLKR